MARNFRVEARKISHHADMEEKQKNFDSLLRNFRRVELETKLIHNLKQREAFEKPGEKKRRKQREAARERYRQEMRNKN